MNLLQSRWIALRKRMEAGAARTVYVLLAPLPRRAILALASGLGTLVYLCSGTSRRIAHANLDLVFGVTLSAGAKRRILRRSYRNMALTALDLFWFSARPVERLRQWVDLEPMEVEALLRRPCLVVSAHLGNWELLGQALALAGLPLASVAMPLKNPEVDVLLNRARSQTGQRILPRAGALKAMLGILRNKGCVGFMLDQNTGLHEGGEFYDFFGVPATVSPVAGLLAYRTGAAIRFVYGLPEPGGRYRVPDIIGFEAPAASELGRDAALREVTTRILREYEDQIRKHPECWMWMYKRWKQIRPGDDARRYPFYSHSLEAP